MNTLILVKRISLLVCLTFSFSFSQAAIISAVADGDWSSSTTWNQGIPKDEDVIIIPAGRTVTVDKQINLDLVQIEVYGTLNFNGGKKITLDDQCAIYIMSPGTIVGNNNGNKIKIGNQFKWQGGDGAIPGDRAVNKDSDPSVSPFFTTQIPQGALLPVELVDFVASLEADYVRIKWTTTLEVNNDYFELMRSNDGLEWHTVTKINGQGFSQTYSEYEYLDESPRKGTNYYKLRQVDLDKSYTYSPIIVVHNLVRSETTAYPNPATDFIYINVNSLEDAELQVFNQNGKLIYQEKTTEEVTQIDLSGFTPGTYYYKMLDKDGGVKTTQKFVKK
jgi:hypothetical protein